MVTAVFLFGPFGAPLAAYLFFCFVSGALIGATGIGGVLLVPMLLLLDVPVQICSIAVLSGFAPAGLACVATHWKSLPRLRTAVLVLSSIPGACAGTAVQPFIPSIAISILIAVVAVYSGGKIVYQAWRRRRRSTQQQQVITNTMMPANVPRSDELQPQPQHDTPLPASADATTSAPPPPPPPPSSALAAAVAAAAVAPVEWRTDPLVGVVAGFLSILTATGGPFIALPLLLALHPTSLPPSTAVAMTTALCIPVSACAALVAGLGASATLDVGLAAAISGPLALGVPVGARLGRRIEPERLKLLIAALLLGIGASAFAKTVVAARGSPS